MSETSALLKTAKAHMASTYQPPDLLLHRGEGACAWDLDGNRYLDFTSGIGVNALGHRHPRVQAALKEQSELLWHCANQFYHPSHVALCEKLTEISFADRVFLSNSGTEAMEAALKLARRHFSNLEQYRTGFIGATGGFHGRSLGALSITHNQKYRDGFGPLLQGVAHVPFNDPEALANRLSPTTAAVILEPVQGNSGVIPAAPGYLEAVRQLCDEAGCLLILDEIQTGIGRTGQWFAYQHSSIQPDILASAKALGGGLPLGATLATEKVAGAFEVGVHGSTFGGNPLSCAAGLATLEVIEDKNLLQNTLQLGDYFAEELKQLSHSGSPLVDVRYHGLLIGVELQTPAKPVRAACREAGLLLTTAGTNVLRILPPLNTTESDIDEAIEILKEVFR